MQDQGPSLKDGFVTASHGFRLTWSFPHPHRNILGQSIDTTAASPLPILHHVQPQHNHEVAHYVDKFNL